jgi:hypothetical protein
MCILASCGSLEVQSTLFQNDSLLRGIGCLGLMIDVIITCYNCPKGLESIGNP